MKAYRKSKVVFLIILGILFAFLPIFTKNTRFNARDRNISSNLKVSVVSEKIHIINNSGWEDFRNDGNCTGDGTYSNPYVIENLVIDGEGSGSCIWIENSNVYFKIMNCIVYNSGVPPDTGIKLETVSNGVLFNNEVSNNSGNGIQVFNCNNNEISRNTVRNNNFTEMGLGNSINNIVSGNTVINNDHNEYTLLIQDSYNNTITGNRCDNGFYGISIDDSDNNVVSENIVNNNNNAGIAVLMADNNIISGNIIDNSIRWGITVYSGDYNTFTENIICNSGSTGLLLGGGMSLSSFNNVYLNCFKNNSPNAGDTGPNNQWDNGVKGNYWDDYIGLDADSNGIGDIPYNITGVAGSQDKFPLMNCPFPPQTGIPGYNLFFLIGILSVVVIVISKKVKWLKQ